MDETSDVADGEHKPAWRAIAATACGVVGWLLTGLAYGYSRYFEDPLNIADNVVGISALGVLTAWILAGYFGLASIRSAELNRPGWTLAPLGLLMAHFSLICFVLLFC